MRNVTIANIVIYFVFLMITAKGISNTKAVTALKEQNMALAPPTIHATI